MENQENETEIQSYCTNCGNTFEVDEDALDQVEIVCPKCDSGECKHE